MNEILNDPIVPKIQNPINELVAALAKAHLEIKAPKKDKVNPMFKSKYSSLDAIYEACREPLARQGLVLSHSVEGNVLITTLRHLSGQAIECRVPMFIDKVTSQGFGSALTYARKYSVCSLLSLPSDEDDDGNAAEQEQKAPSRIKKLSFIEIDQIKQLIADDDALMSNLLNAHKVKHIHDLEGDFQVIYTNLRAAKGVK